MAEPSVHRRCLLQLSRSLEQQDINELIYLSEDFIPVTEVGSVKSGVDLMRCLEKHGRLGPGNYHYLACCLGEIGRLDLVQKLEFCSSGGQQLSPHGHCLHWKKKAIEDKQKQLLQVKGEVQELSQNSNFWDTWMGETLQKLSTQLEITDSGPQPIVKAHSTNKALKAAGKLITGVIQNAGTFIAKLEQILDSSPREFTELQILERFEEDLSAALSFSPERRTTPTTKVELLVRLKEQHPLSLVAGKVLSCSSDLLKELRGETEAKKQLKDLEDSVLAIRSLLHINAHLCFGFLSLIHITDIVAASETEVLDQEAKCMIASLVHLFPYGATLSVLKPTLEALKGTSVLTALKEDEKMQPLFTTNPPVIPCPCKANKSLRFGIFTVLLTLYKSTNLKQCEWKKIQSQMAFQVQMNLSEPNYDPFLEIDMIVMNSLERLLKHFST